MAELSKQQAANVELARKLLGAFQRGDVETARAFIDPEGEVTSDPVGINTGVYRGYEGYMTWLGQWLEAWDQAEGSLRSTSTRAQPRLCALPSSGNVPPIRLPRRAGED